MRNQQTYDVKLPNLNIYETKCPNHLRSRLNRAEMEAAHPLVFVSKRRHKI